MSTTGSYPIGRKSAHGEPRPATNIERSCATCGASFLGLAPGKTRETGIWNAWRWFCSIECTPNRILTALGIEP